MIGMIPLLHTHLLNNELNCRYGQTEETRICILEPCAFHKCNRALAENTLGENHKRNWQEFPHWPLVARRLQGIVGGWPEAKANLNGRSEG
jgi:hypothetical protein